MSKYKKRTKLLGQDGKLSNNRFKSPDALTMIMSGCKPLVLYNDVVLAN